MNARNFLEEHNIKATTLRIKLVEILQNAKAPLSYDEILESLDANKTTFYRSMEIFEKENLVIKTENNHKSYYELANEAKAYFICDVCHKVTNIDMVKPIEARNPKPKMRCHVIFFERLPSPNLLSNQTAKTMPRGLPNSSPNITPRAT